MKLPQLHRIHGEFTLMDSKNKELFIVTTSALDELVRRSNAHDELLWAANALAKEIGKSADMTNGISDKVFTRISAAMRKAKATT